jgi:hypothetical protein
VPVQLAVTSKPERGYALIAGRKPSAVGATLRSASFLTTVLLMISRNANG